MWKALIWPVFILVLHVILVLCIKFFRGDVWFGDVLVMLGILDFFFPAALILYIICTVLFVLFRKYQKESLDSWWYVVFGVASLLIVWFIPSIIIISGNIPVSNWWWLNTPPSFVW